MADHELSNSNNNNNNHQPQPHQPPTKIMTSEATSVTSSDGHPTAVDPAIDAKERLQRFDLVIQHLHRLRATLALDSSVREFQKIHTLTLLGQLPVPPAAVAGAGSGGVVTNNSTTSSSSSTSTTSTNNQQSRVPLPGTAVGPHHLPLNHQNGGLLPLPDNIPPLPPPPSLHPHMLGMRPGPPLPPGIVHQQGLMPPRMPLMVDNIIHPIMGSPINENGDKPSSALNGEDLSMEEDMDDLLEHIEEDVELPDDDEDEEIEEEELNGGSSEEHEPDKKSAKLDPDAICTKPNLASNGIATTGSKLPTLPPLPPPLLNLEFLKYLMTKTAAMHFGGPAAAASGGHPGGMGGSSSGSGMGVSGGGGSGSSTSGRDVKPHQCQQCLKTFSSNHQLVQHIRVHTGEKPYKCSYCDRRFKQLSHVQQHTRLHTGERPYKCHVPDCGRAFIQLSNLQQHLRNHESQLERLKNRPFHCAICGKGFATESSMRTHNSKHTALVGGPNPSCCPICQKLCISGEELMEHMKYVHKDPNASGVPAKRRSANHPCPVCGKFYVNEGSLRKHLACHPEMTSQLSSSLRMWPCSVCTAVFTHENGLLAHMDQMRMDPKHQFAAQYVLSRAANERREREALLAAHLAMTTNMQPSLLSGHMSSAAAAHHMAAAVSTAAASVAANPGGTASPSAHSDSSTRISTPMNTAAEMKMEPRTTNVRSPLSLGLTHHQQQQQQQLMGQGANSLDYLGRNHTLGGDLTRNNSNDLRLSSPTPTNNGDLMGNNNNGTDHLLTTTADAGAAGHPQQQQQQQQVDQLHSPQAQRPSQNSSSLEANNAAFMALRANPETTIRPLNSSSGLGSPGDITGGNAVVGGAGNNPSAVSTDLHTTTSHDPQFSAASELINRYRVEQTMAQLRGHLGFGSDHRGIPGLPFNQHNQV